MAALAKYKYLGLSSVVEVDYPQPQVKLALWAAGSPPTYPGLDRFGRVVDHRWINYGATPDEDIARIQHGYDRNSNRLWRQNDVARALSKKFDQQYTYDGLNRLTDAKTGLLNGSHVIPTGGDRTFEQQWTLDKTGNWSQFKQDDNGGTFDLQQTRTANQVNEITAIGASAGPVWATPAYDPAGNTTSFPKPADPTESFTAVYDAWNRMVKVSQVAQSSSSSSSSSSGATSLQTIQENVYDARNYRIIKKTYDGGDLDETRHCYFTSEWQNIEERVDASTGAERQHIWGIRYIDDLVLRARDTTDPRDGTLDERLYHLQDSRYSVIALLDEGADVVKRYEFDVYGLPIELDGQFDPVAPSSSSAGLLFTGRAFDYSLNLYDFRNRIYIHSLGNFLSRDALQYVDGASLYLAYFALRGGLDPFGLDDIRLHEGTNIVRWMPEGAFGADQPKCSVDLGLLMDQDFVTFDPALGWDPMPYSILKTHGGEDSIDELIAAVSTAQAEARKSSDKWSKGDSAADYWHLRYTITEVQAGMVAGTANTRIALLHTSWVLGDNASTIFYGTLGIALGSGATYAAQRKNFVAAGILFAAAVASEIWGWLSWTSAKHKGERAKAAQRFFGGPMLAAFENPVWRSNYDFKTKTFKKTYSE